MHRIALVAVVACGGPSQVAPLRTRAPLTLSEAGLGPIRAGSWGTVDAVQLLLPGYDVSADDDDGFGSDDRPWPPNVWVSADGERLFVVAPRDDSHVGEIEITSARIAFRDSRIGTALADPGPFEGCFCTYEGWRCAGKGSHIAAVIEDACRGRAREVGVRAALNERTRFERGDPATLATLKGRRIVSLIWRPRPFQRGF